MIAKVNQYLQHAVRQLCDHWRLLTTMGLLAIGALVTVIVFCYYLVASSATYVLPPQDIKKVHIKTGLVLGAGISANGKPYKELEARLNVAANALQSGAVTKLILSGDNRFVHYNEPKAMRDYLIKNRHIPARQLVLDYAGRSTYESCERAAKIFGQKQLIIFSAGSHLPRAIYLCRHFGIESYGVSSRVEANNGGRRELLARVKAVYNIYIRSEKTVLGPSVKM